MWNLLAMTLPWNAEAMVRLAVAAALGSLIGAEREYHGRSAGFRTQLLVSLGSALAMVVSLHFGRQYGAEPASGAIRVDPARVAYGVMGGIGFLGAGAIVRYGVGVRGLTTAASLWCTAAVGLACGFGMFSIAAATTAIVVFTLMVLTRLDAWIPSRWYKTVEIHVPADGQDHVSRLQQIVARCGGRIINTEYRYDVEDKSERITLHLVMPPRARISDLLRLNEQMPEIRQVSVH